MRTIILMVGVILTICTSVVSLGAVPAGTLNVNVNKINDNCDSGPCNCKCSITGPDGKAKACTWKGPSAMSEVLSEMYGISCKNEGVANYDLEVKITHGNPNSGGDFGVCFCTSNIAGKHPPCFAAGVFGGDFYYYLSVYQSLRCVVEAPPTK